MVIVPFYCEAGSAEGIHKSRSTEITVSEKYHTYAAAAHS